MSFALLPVLKVWTSGTDRCSHATNCKAAIMVIAAKTDIPVSHALRNIALSHAEHKGKNFRRSGLSGSPACESILPSVI
jgi:hypothetical protein